MPYTGSIAELAARNWDAIVIGSGLGGSFAALVLAQAGQSVLIVEQAAAPRDGAQPQVTQLVAEVSLDGAPAVLMPTTIAAAGGTSVVYAAALERRERHDTDDLPGDPHPTGGWPAGFDAFAPFYAKAESMLHVCGDADPLGSGDYRHLRPAPKMSPGDFGLMAAFKAQGLHPYRNHIGMDYGAACQECIGKICPNACKGEARSAAFECPSVSWTASSA